MWHYQPFSLLLGYLLDLVIGDPLWLPHPVRLMGWGISKMETLLRRKQPSTPQKERIGGFILAFTIPVLAYLIPWAILWAVKRIHPNFSSQLSMVSKPAGMEIPADWGLGRCQICSFYDCGA